MSETTERSAYDKLSPQRKQLADMLVANLDSGGLGKQGWRTRGAPENADPQIRSMVLARGGKIGRGTAYTGVLDIYRQYRAENLLLL